ncbi:MAG TPA: glucoamylase family protein [Bacteroidales bacterium]|nr:glucoamylase family protein [Bacteroidales bacterium]
MKKTVLLFVGISVLFTACSSKQLSQKAKDEKGNHRLSDDSLLNLVEYNTFQYFWDGAEPVSGMARERYHVDGVYEENDMNVVTSGGSGFGIMAILVGIERNFITRTEGYNRLLHIVNFLKKADRFHGAWPHWLYGETGKVKPFSTKDNGADIVETAYLMQGLLTAREYFRTGSDEEQQLAAEIDNLWKQVEWNWFTKNGKEDFLYWHWSPNYNWEMNNPVRGYNECLITYVLAASSPTYPISPDAYHKGWARNGTITSGNEKYGYKLIMKFNGAEEFGGPLFWAHYSYLGLDPSKIKDRYADYWTLNRNQSLINWEWCKRNPLHYKAYSDSCWGLTAGYSTEGYAAHAPGERTDLGVITPSAALSSFPYTPEQSMKALKYFYFTMGDKIFGKYGFYDGFSVNKNWYPKRYLAIDQGPEIVMIENYRSGLCWKYFMQAPEVIKGLERLGFTISK